MRLKDWLKKNRIPITEFAEMINYNRITISEVISGRRKAGRKLIKLIEEATFGQVKAEDILKPYVEKKKI